MVGAPGTNCTLCSICRPLFQAMFPIRLWLALQFIVVAVFFWVLCRDASQSLPDLVHQEVEEFTFKTSVLDCFCVETFSVVVLAVLWQQKCLKHALPRIMALLAPLASSIYLIVKFSEVSLDHLQSLYGNKTMAYTLLTMTIVFNLLNFICSICVLGGHAAEYTTLATEDCDEESPCDAEPPKQKKVTLKRMIGLAKPERTLLTVGTVMLVFSSFSQLAMPYVFGKVVDAVGSTEKSSSKLMVVSGGPSSPMHSCLFPPSLSPSPKCFSTESP